MVSVVVIFYVTAHNETSHIMMIGMYHRGLSYSGAQKLSFLILGEIQSCFYFYVFLFS